MRKSFLTAARLCLPDPPERKLMRQFPLNIPAIRALAKMDGIDFHRHVTFFIGENGAGKSTLLEGLADCLRFDEQGGSLNFNLNSDEPFTELRQYLRLNRTLERYTDDYFLRAESFNNVVRRIDELGVGGYGGYSLNERSHGEGFLALLSHRLQGHGLYLFDEPEAALSVQSQFAALGFMHNLVQSGSQFIIATHSPILLAYPDAYIYRFSEDGIERISYEQTEPYVLTRSFLENPQRMIREIFAD